MRKGEVQGGGGQISTGFQRIVGNILLQEDLGRSGAHFYTSLYKLETDREKTIARKIDWSRLNYEISKERVPITWDFVNWRNHEKPPISRGGGRLGLEKRRKFHAGESAEFEEKCLERCQKTKKGRHKSLNTRRALIYLRKGIESWVGDR